MSAANLVGESSFGAKVARCSAALRCQYAAAARLPCANSFRPLRMCDLAVLFASGRTAPGKLPLRAAKGSATGGLSLPAASGENIRLGRAGDLPAPFRLLS